MMDCKKAISIIEEAERTMGYENVMKEPLMLAISALHKEKTMAISVKECTEIFHGKKENIVIYSCPCCKIILFPRPRPNYCRRCGTHLAWGE